MVFTSAQQVQFKRKTYQTGITIGSDDTSLGGTITDLNGITSLDVDNITLMQIQYLQPTQMVTWLSHQMEQA